MRLEEILIRLSEIWCAESGLKESTLSGKLANDGKMLSSVRDGSFVTTGKYQDFLSWFRDSANWPGGAVPAEAVVVLGLLANIAVSRPPSSGKLANLTDDLGRVA